MPFSLILLQLAIPSSSGALLAQVLPILLMIAIFYFLVFMPMRRQQAKTKEMLKSLQNGQTVLTSGGLVGIIVSVDDDSLIIRIKPDNVKLQVARSAVTSVVTSDNQLKKA